MNDPPLWLYAGVFIAYRGVNSCGIRRDFSLSCISLFIVGVNYANGYHHQNL